MAPLDQRAAAGKVAQRGESGEHGGERDGLQHLPRPLRPATARAPRGVTGEWRRTERRRAPGTAPVGEAQEGAPEHHGGLAHAHKGLFGRELRQLAEQHHQRRGRHLAQQVRHLHR